jgi:hypothetical protein
VESIENKKKNLQKLLRQGNENNGTDTISANDPASFPRPGILPGLSVPVSEDKSIVFRIAL